MVYGEHFFEHLEYPTEAFQFLSEALRILQPNGLLSLSVPEAELALKAYISKETWSSECVGATRPDLVRYTDGLSQLRSSPGE
jgi:predicted SAM-dependent methyltransferase